MGWGGLVGLRVAYSGERHLPSTGSSHHGELLLLFGGVVRVLEGSHVAHDGLRSDRLSGGLLPIRASMTLAGCGCGGVGGEGGMMSEEISIVSIQD